MPHVPRHLLRDTPPHVTHGAGTLAVRKTHMLGTHLRGSEVLAADRRPKSSPKLARPQVTQDAPPAGSPNARAPSSGARTAAEAARARGAAGSLDGSPAEPKRSKARPKARTKAEHKARAEAKRKAKRDGAGKQKPGAATLRARAAAAAPSGSSSADGRSPPAASSRPRDAQLGPPSSVGSVMLSAWPLLIGPVASLCVCARAQGRRVVTSWRSS